MIESKIYDWVDLGDSMQLIDVYSKKPLSYFFKFFQLLIYNRNYSTVFIVILKIFLFLQIMMLSIINVSPLNDLTLKICNPLSRIFLLQDLILTKDKYIISMVIVTILFIVMASIIIYIIISIKNRKTPHRLVMQVINFINEILFNFLIGPFANIFFSSIRCKENMHTILKVPCYTNWVHLLILVASLIYLIFFLGYTLLLSIYYNQIGSLQEINNSRINCYFELYFTILKVIVFIFALFIKHTLKSAGFLIGYQIMLFLFEFILVVYIHKKVLYYNMTLNLINKIGWMFICWFSLLVMIKLFLNISDITLFVIIGWIIISVYNHYYDQYQIKSSLTNINIFEVKSLQEIEYYVTRLLNYKDTYDIKIKIIMKGVITRFENWLQTTCNEKLEKYNRISLNSHLNSRINNQLTIPIISMIYLIYEHHLEKSLIKTEIFLVMGYFLIKHLKNWVYAISLISKIKVTNHKDLYLKYCLTEEIKEMLIMKMVKGLNHSRDSIKSIDISSVLLYNIYIDSFKLKIYDAACNQIDYFDILRNNTTTDKTTLNLIKVGKDIISLRKEIISLWNKINELNPFSAENEKDYMLYLETVIQDNELAKQEEKYHHANLINLNSEKNNLYHSLFLKEFTAIVLIDGYSANLRAIYATPNFAQMFNYQNKEVLNSSVEEFIPKPVSSFHHELVHDAVKYSNLQAKFRTQGVFLLKGKSGGIFSVKAYLKALPNLSFGLIYVASITKQQERNFIIVLDKDFKVCGLSDILSQGGGGMSFTVNSNYGLSETLCGHHIALVLPEILLQIRYKNQKFTLKKKDIDLKGNLYPTSQFRGLDEKIDHVLDRIKQCGKLQSEDTENNDSIHEYRDLISELGTKYPHPFSIFFKVTLRSFLNNKHQYYLIYITKDLVSENEMSGIGNNAYSHNNNESDSKYQDGMMRRQENKSGIIQENNNNNHSFREIKLNVINKQSENKQLLERKKVTQGDNNDHDDNSNNNHDKKDNNQSKQDKEAANISMIPKKIIKSTPEFTAFRMIKQRILSKRELIQSQEMKFVTLVYALISMGLMLTNYYLLNTSYIEMNDFLFQNTFFNKSKIVASSVYINGINLKMIKYDFFSESNSFCVDQCSLLYNNKLANSTKELKSLKENNSYFYEDYKQIFSQTTNLSIQVYKEGLFDIAEMDVNNALNVIISNGLIIIPHLDDYLSDKPSPYDINCANLIDLSYHYFTNDQINGFNETTKTEKVRRLQSSFVCMIIQLVIFIIAITCLSALIIKILTIEHHCLRRIISYQSASFDLYIKRLEELKKKLRNETGEDDDRINEEKNDESKSSKEGDIASMKEGHHGNKKKDKDGNNKKNKDSNDKSKKSNKHHRSKQAKLQQKQNEKITIMSNFFYKYNLLFSFKVLAVFIISLSYYLVAMILNGQRIQNMISLDNSMNAIQSIFNHSYSLFIILKMILLEYANYEIEKGKGIKAIKGGQLGYTINGKVFTSVDEIEKSFYIFTMSDLKRFEVPKVGNLLMPLAKSAESNSKGVENINSLFNEDVCAFLTIVNSSQYDQCSKFWSSILLKGLDQSITQMGVVMNAALDQVLLLNSQGITIEEIFEDNSSFSQIDFFMNFYLYPGFKETVLFFNQINLESLQVIQILFLWISIGFVGAELILLIIVIFIIHSSKEVYDSFLNFIVIFPYQYLMEDENIAGDFENLEKKLFHFSI